MAGSLVEINDQDFEEMVLNSKIPVLVDFWAPWCGPCVALTPTMTQIAEEFSGKVLCVKMNVDENANIPAEYAIRSIPSLLLFKDSQVVNSLTGNHPKEKIRNFVSSAL